MSSAFRPSPTHGRFLLSSCILALSLGAGAAQAQQIASPNLLPPVEIVTPRPNAATAQPAQTRTRRAARRPAPPAETVTAAPNPFPPVVISPTGIATSVDRVASSVSVVTQKDIETQQYRAVPDVLATIPGLNVVQTGGPGGQTSVFMRGTNSNHTKVLIDGIDVGDPSTPNGAFDYANLLTANVQQIEVLRGPQSGLYGSDAIGGVISVITRKGEGPARVSGTFEAGSFNTFNQNIGLSGSKDNVNYAFSVAHLHAGDVPVTPQQSLPPGQRAIGNNYDNKTISSKVGVDLNENLTINSVLRYTDALLYFTGDDFNFPSAPNPTQSSHAVQQFATREEAVWTALDGRIRSYFGVNYSNNNRFDRSPTSATPSSSTGDRLKFDWHTVAEITRGNNIVVGAEQQTDRLSSAEFVAQTGNKAGFVELQSQLADRIFVVANVREDSHDQFGNHTTWRVAPAVIVPVTETKLKASYGTGFKAPSLSQLLEKTLFSTGNPNLKPEESTGYDVGFEQPFFNDQVRFGATYFRNDITNLINSNTSFTSYVNVDLATTEGTESFVTARITERFGIRADYTYTRAVNALTGATLLRRPKEKWSATATWLPIDALTLSATVLHLGTWRDIDRSTFVNLDAPGFTLVNLRGDYALNDQVKLFARVDNLFDVRYQNPTGFLAPGLGVFGGVRLASYGVQ
ncbi:TonB-dependent receptor [Tardiphaga alba]|uniref:TonB-dependent receptor n=1 Tax=Tardiphaga alba TaxID=340268 RepID=A0ABX8A9W3_9BRAD|nr:TonB-dependent receptor [Tardiphaga alba]QUS39791.1 TonB-dependent receptor [Tardiphaga alba]